MKGQAVTLGALAVFIVSLAYFVSYLPYGLAYDEGYLLDGVDKILDGQVIYRDFYHTYAPGRFYLVASAFKIFGKSLLVERWIFALLEALKCAVAFLIVHRVTRSRLAFMAPLLLALAPGPWHKVFFSSIGMLATLAVVVYIRRGPKAMVAAGLILGGCAVMRQDVAGFAAVGAVAGIAINGIAEHRGLRDSLLRLIYMAAGLLAVAVAVLLFFGFQQALGPMIRDLTVEGMRDNMTNVIPYPGLAARTPPDWTYFRYVLPVRLLFYLPFAVYIASIVPVIRSLVLRRWTPAMTSLVVVLLVSVLAFNQSVWRSDLGHLLQTLQYVLVLIPIALAFAFRGLAGRWGRLVKAVLVVLPPSLLVWANFGVVAASTNGPVMPLFSRERISVGDLEYLGSIAVKKGNDTRLHLERAPVYVRPGEAAFFETLGRFLDRNTMPGDYVLAVPQLQVVYFFYDRKNPTRYAHYRRALEPSEEERYIEDIIYHDTEYILLTEPFEGAILGNTRESFASYGRRVREWILANYTEVEQLGPVRILKRSR